MLNSTADLRRLKSEIWAGTIHGFASIILRNFGAIVLPAHSSRKRLGIIGEVLSDVRSCSSIPNKLYEISLVSRRRGGVLIYIQL